jgi:hypothetical protein
MLRHFLILAGLWASLAVVFVLYVLIPRRSLPRGKLGSLVNGANVDDALRRRYAAR